MSLNMSKFDTELLTAPKNLKDFIHYYNCKKEIFNLKEWHDTTELTTNKSFFSDNYVIDVFLFVTAVISLLATNLAIYLLCKHKKLRMLVASLALQQVREDGAATTQKGGNTECKIQANISLALTTLGLVMVATLNYRK